MARLRIAKAAAVVVVVALVGQLVRQSSALVVPGTSGTTRRPLSSVGGQQQQRHEPSASSAPTYRSNVASDRRKLSISHEVVGGLASLVGPVGSPLFLFPTDTDDSPSTSSTSSTTTKEKKKEEEEKATSMAKEEFWKAQAALASSMSEKADRIDKAETRDKFAKRRLALVNETLLFSTIIFSCIWLVGSNPFTAISYAFGATLGTAYSYGLGKYVETIGGSADDVEDLQGAGVGQARFAFLILLFVFVGKFRSVGLQEIPSIVGFFTYQIASLSQGLREYDD